MEIKARGLTRPIMYEDWNDEINRVDESYHKWLTIVRNSLHEFLEKSSEKSNGNMNHVVVKLFKTDVTGLWDIFINNIDESIRQMYNCNTCRHFIERFGDLVSINDDGTLNPILWSSLDDVPDTFKDSVNNMINVIKRSKVTRLFVPEKNVLGTDMLNGYNHFAVRVPKSMIIERRKKHEENPMVREFAVDLDCLNRALFEYDIETINEAIKMFEVGEIYNSSKFIHKLKWFHFIHKQYNIMKDERAKHNLLCLKVALNPTYGRIKNSIIGTLLDDIKDKKSYDYIVNHFNEKADPIAYMRPKAAPAVGNINRAEELIKELGLEKSLERRYARLDEIPTIWKPSTSDNVDNKQGGVFSHLLKNNEREEQIPKVPPIKISWSKFSREVLPNVISMKLKVPAISNKFIALITANHDDAPPIIKYDKIDKRNPFSQYMYHDPTYASVWNLHEGYVNVTAITTLPIEFDKIDRKEYKSIIYILENCKDTISKNTNIGNALFPELLIPELHEVRSTIEAYSACAKLYGYEESSACGIFSGGNNMNDIIRVTRSDVGVVDYLIAYFE